MATNPSAMLLERIAVPGPMSKSGLPEKVPATKTLPAESEVTAVIYVLSGITAPAQPHEPEPKDSRTSVTEIEKAFSVVSPPWSVDRTRME